jgi:hypothetical protein
MAFSLFRVAAIQLGVYARARQGNASSASARLFGDSYRMVAEAGLAACRGDSAALTADLAACRVETPPVTC